MKVSDTSVIQSSERELMDAIIAELDWAAIEKMLRKKHRIGLQDDVSFREGDLVVHEGKVAYKLSFDVKITLDILFDRKGDCIYLSASGSEEENEDSTMPDETAVPPSRVTEMASDLADMVEEINGDAHIMRDSAMDV